MTERKTTASPFDLPSNIQGLVNLASPRLGTDIHSCSDDFFASASRMLQDQLPIFIADKYDDHGKWMDGWESRRRRGGGHDYCIIRLGVKGVIHAVDIDTSFFTGNYPPEASLEGTVCDGELDKQTKWRMIIPMTPLNGDSHHFIRIEHSQTEAFTHLRLNIFPDGGVARLRIYGQVSIDWFKDNHEYELSAIELGGRILAYNDAHYGDPWAILCKGRGINMGDGWETRRRREPGNDWIIVQLGTAGIIQQIEVDTAHYKGNYPDRCSIQAAMIDEDATDMTSMIEQSSSWQELLPQQKLSMDHVHNFDNKLITDIGSINCVRLNIFPDGGISRLRLFGHISNK